MDANSAAAYRRALASQLREQAPEIESAIADRVSALERPLSSPEISSVGGTRKIIRQTVEYGLRAIEVEDVHAVVPPAIVGSHARQAASRSVSLQILLSRYFACYSLFKDFVIRESELMSRRPRPWFRQVAATTDVAFERLIEVLGVEYQHERDRKHRSRRTRQLESVEAMLAGELVSLPDLGYDLAAVHTGVVGFGPVVPELIIHIAKRLGARRLIVHPSPGEVWAWLGSNEGHSAAQLARLLSCLPEGNRLAIGEPAAQVHGWRQTHQQARAASAVAVTDHRTLVRYAEVPLLASAARDSLLKGSLRTMYLRPLEAERDGGHALRQTLLAYFTHGRNGTSTSAALGVSRQTVLSHLRRAEERLGVSLDTHADALTITLQLEEAGLLPPE